VSPFVRRLGPSRALRAGAPVDVLVDGDPVRAQLGESVLGVLMAQGGPALRTTAAGEPRGAYCAMGSCFECLVEVDGVAGTRACMTLVRHGMRIVHQQGAG